MVIPTRLDAALAHAAHGLKVFPLHHVTRSGDCSCQAGADCGSKGKHPRFERWQELATTAPDRIRQWWTTRPMANIGIACGTPSGCFVLDVDPRHGGDVTLANLEAEHGALPPTVEAVTGSGGRHLFFSLPDREPPNEVSFAPGLDVRSTGGLVAAAGSNHVSGRTYEWAAEHHPTATPLAGAPEWLLRLIWEASGRVSGREASNSPPVSEKFPHGTQHDTLVRIAGGLRQRGLDAEEIEGALQVINRKRCERPGPPENIREIAASMMRYSPGAIEPWREPPPEELEPEANGTAAAVEPAALPAEPEKPPRPYGAVTRRLSDVEPEEVCWLWPGRIPLGKITILDGDPGLGKSLLTLDLAARVSSGQAMPDGYPSELEGPAGVIILSAEDGLGDTIKPRLMAAGADCERIVALEGVRTEPKEGQEPVVSPVCLIDLEVLEEAIVQAAGRPARLLIVDPLMAFIPVAYDSHNDQQVRAVLTGLVALAGRTGCAILLIRHLNKTPGGNPLYRGGGSIGIVGAARSGLLVAPDPRDEAGLLRVLASTKSNLGAPPPSLGFRIEEVTSRGLASPVVRWEGAADMDARELLGGAKPLGETAQAILDAFVMDGEEVSPAEMAERLQRPLTTVKTTMWRLSQRGLLVNHGGRYARR